jgi:hypothetical protein
MDRIARDNTIQALREQLELSRVQAASLDNDGDRRDEMTHTTPEFSFCSISYKKTGWE